MARSLSFTQLVYRPVSFSPGHPQGAGTPDPWESIFPREHRAACPGMGSPGSPCSRYDLPEQGLMSLRHQTPHCSQQKFVEPKVLEIKLAEIFPHELFSQRRSQQGVRRDKGCMGSGLGVGRDGAAPLPCAQRRHASCVP